MSRFYSTRLLKPDPPSAHLEWAWFCLRTQQKHEQVAARCLRQMERVEVFNPCLRMVQVRRAQKVWITGPLFPGYLFARFNWKESLSMVHYAPGVQSVVHFGNGWPIVPEEVIAELRRAVGPQELLVLSDDLTPGDEVELIGELFHGFKAVVTQVMPAHQRVAVLLEFLGRQLAVKISTQSLVKQRRSL